MLQKKLRNGCILIQQVVATEEDKTPPSAAKPPPRTDGLNDSLASHISSVAFKLALSEEEHNVSNKALTFCLV